MMVVLVLDAEVLARKLPELQKDIYTSMSPGSAGGLVQVWTLNVRLME